MIPRPVSSETEMVVTITLASGGQTQVITRKTAVMPWVDDRAEQAGVLLEMFTSWLSVNRPELNVTPETEFTGTFLAPQLLVVSHYDYFCDEWEVGLSWHIMVPPDDFAEVYLRPRTELRPTLAFRVDSWQTALDDGNADIHEVPPPPEVVR